MFCWANEVYLNANNLFQLFNCIISEKKFSYDYKTRMILSMTEKTLFFIKKNLNLRNIIILIMFFVIKFSITIAFTNFFKKWLNFHKSWLLFSGKIFSITVPFSILKISNKASKIVVLKAKMFLLKNFFNDFSHWKLHF